jgi:uncharacterized protein YidB (DUF937 family)
VSSGFEQILGGILGGGGGGQSGGGKGAAMAGMAAVAAPMILKFLQGGGLNKLLGNMQSKGMEDKAQSWVSKGENKAITPQELEQVVPKEQIDQLAQQTGATPEQAEEGCWRRLCRRSSTRARPRASCRNRRSSTTCLASCSARSNSARQARTLKHESGV